MRATYLGIVFSVIFHGLLGVSIYAFEKVSANRPKPFKLDISFVYDFVPKGNSLDESLLKEEQPKKIREKKDNSNSPAKSKNSETFSEEKRYGVANGDEGADSIYIKQNLGAIKARIRNIINYPAIARRMGWAGRGFITFLLNEEGKILNVKVAKSTGYPVLDKSAIKAVLGLSGLPKPPIPTLITLPFSFALK
jgi:TonB family protein